MTIEFAQIISTIDQRPETTDPVPVFMDQNDAISGIEHSSEHPADIRIIESGTYVVIAAPQVGRKSGNEARYVDFWLRKNGTDIANSNVRCTITNGNDKDVIVNQTMMPFKAGDVLNVIMAVEQTGEGLGIEGPEYDYIQSYIEFYCSEADRRCKKIDMKKTVDQVIDSMKEDLPSYKYGIEHKEWANIARVGNYIMEFQCKECSFIVPELCY